MAHASHASHEEHVHSPSYYVKIWGLLLVLLVISVAGPELGIRTLTLITAFGIAFVKAWVVAVYFMHLKVEKRYVTYLLLSMVLMVGLFFAAVMTDVLKTEGQHWNNTSAKELIEYHKANPSSGHPADEHGTKE